MTTMLRISLITVLLAAGACRDVTAPLVLAPLGSGHVGKGTMISADSARKLCGTANDTTKRTSDSTWTACITIPR